MKTLKILLFTLFISLTAVVVAQPNPAISKKYSDAEVEKLVNDYKTSYSKDVVPTDALKRKFEKDFPNARDIDWELGANVYEVEFEINRTDYKAFYDSNANLLMYQFEIYDTDLPKNIKNVITSKYPDYRFEDQEKIIKGTKTFYKVEIERGNNDVKLLLDSEGVILSERFD